MNAGTKSSLGASAGPNLTFAPTMRRRIWNLTNSTANKPSSVSRRSRRTGPASLALGTYASFASELLSGAKGQGVSSAAGPPTWDTPSTIARPSAVGSVATSGPPAGEGQVARPTTSVVEPCLGRVADMSVAATANACYHYRYHPGRL